MGKLDDTPAPHGRDCKQRGTQDHRAEPEDAMDEAVQMPIDGTLDLHTFLPREVKPLLQDYLGECQRLGILDVRVVHGKGTGSLRRSVHAILGRLPLVARFQQAGAGGGGWGATLVRLHPVDSGAVKDSSHGQSE